MNNEEMEEKALAIFNMLGMKKANGYYRTNWGRKTELGVIASIFNILADNSKKGKDGQNV